MKNKIDVKCYPELSRGSWAEKKLKELLQKLPNSTVSDIGAGFGWFGPIVKRNGLRWQAFDQIKKTEEIEVWDLNQPAPDFSSTPGLIVFLEVLEHLSNPQEALRNITNHLCSGGYLIITTPNPFYSKSKFDIIFKNKFYAFQPKHLKEHHVFIPLPHVVEFHLNKMSLKLEEYAIIGKNNAPKFSKTGNYFKAWTRYVCEELISFGDKKASGHTQAFLFRKDA